MGKEDRKGQGWTAQSTLQGNFPHKLVCACTVEARRLHCEGTIILASSLLDEAPVQAIIMCRVKNRDFGQKRNGGTQKVGK